MNERILVVEDDAALSRILKDMLAFEGFIVDGVTDGDCVLGKVNTFVPDLIVLDLRLPHQDGLELCGRLRRDGRTPIVILSARSQKTDKLRGLALGADDYVTKPFDLDELLARIRAVLRRTRPTVHRLVLGSVTVDFLALRASNTAHQRLSLSHREFKVLRYLAEREGLVVSRNELLTHLWCYADLPITRSVDHAIARLRKKIEADPHNPRFIHTVHGDGYCLTPEGCDNVRHFA